MSPFDWETDPVLEEYSWNGRQVVVVRDDILRGGSKTRFLSHLVRGHKEVVYAGPFCGGAPLALAVLGRDLGFKVTLFYAARKVLHPRQRKAVDLGAEIHGVRPGYMAVNQKRARDYCLETGAHFLSLGFDGEEAELPFIEIIRRVGFQAGSVDEVWCATGSGMLARCLGLAFPSTRIVGVAVGLAKRWSKQVFPRNVEIIPARLRFEQKSRVAVPFDACPHYERKAWEVMETRSAGGRVLFWNVSGVV